MGNSVNIQNVEERKYLDSLFKGYFIDQYEQSIENNKFLQMVDTIEGSSKTVALGYLKGLAGVVEMKDARVFNRLDPKTFSIDYKKFDLSYKVSADDIMNDQIGQYEKVLRGMAEEHANFVQERFIEALDSNGVCYDGSAFFGSGHFGGQDNDLTSVASADNAVPTVAEFQEAVREARASMLGFQKGSGKPANFGAGMLDLVVEPKLAGVAYQVANNSTIANSDNELAGTLNIVVSAYITGSAISTRFYLLDNNKIIRPLVMFLRDKLKINSELENGHFSIIQDDYAYTSTARFEISYGDWKGAVKYTFTT